MRYSIIPCVFENRDSQSKGDIDLIQKTLSKNLVVLNSNQKYQYALTKYFNIYLINIINYTIILYIIPDSEKAIKDYQNTKK